MDVSQRLKNWLTSNLFGYTTVYSLETCVSGKDDTFIDLTCLLDHEYYAKSNAGIQYRNHNCDDVLSEQTAMSKAERTKVNKWYVSGLRSRLSPTPQGGELIINTRWALDDLSGHTVKVDSKGRRPWKVISVPAILDEAASALLRRSNDPVGLYEVGTSFWPEFQPVDELEERKREFEAEGSPEKWHALYMQNPIPPTGNIIKFEDWMPWEDEEPPVCSQIVIGMDTAFSTSSKADFSAYVVLGVFAVKEVGYRGDEYWRNHSILLQAGRGRWDFGTLCEKTLQLNEQFKPDVIVIEKRASGQSLLQEMRYRGLPLHEFISDKDKETRLNAVSPMFKAKTVWYPDHEDYKEWTSILIDEVCTFPSGSNDDLVDALSSALIYLRENMSIVHPEDFVLQSEGQEDKETFGSKIKTYWSSIMQKG